MVFSFLSFSTALGLIVIFFYFVCCVPDISFWKNKKSMEGLSIRSIFLNVFFQAIIFLYLLDNETSTVILVSSGIGLLIEIWKINKAMNVSVSPSPL